MVSDRSLCATRGAFKAFDADGTVHTGKTAVFDFEAIIAWVIIGGIAGWMAGLIVEGYGFGLIGNIVVGIIGATIASLITPLLGVNIETTLGHIIAATLGAIVLLVLVGGLRRR